MIKTFSHKNFKFTDFISEFKKNGSCIVSDLFDSKLIKNSNQFLDKKSPNVTIPYFDLPWGYGNLISNDYFKKFTQILSSEILDYYFPESFIFNHLVVNEKPAYVSIDVEWHQESFNINTFAPGCDPLIHREKFIQVFVALDDQNSNNGGLAIFYKSHELGLLNYVDILSPLLTHKRHVSTKDMKKLLSSCDLIYPKLKTGDALFFSPLTVHGSYKNNSSKRRRSIVIQAQSKDCPKWDEEIYSREVNFRKSFVLDNLKNRIKFLQNSEIYQDLKSNS